MPLLLRFVATRGAWNGEARSLERALKDFTLRAGDTDGLSLFEIEDERARRIAVANQAIARGDDGPFDYIEVERSIVEAIGPVTDTREGTSFPAADALHRSLNWTQDQLDRLATVVFESQTVVTRIKREQARAALREVDTTTIADAAQRAFAERYRA